MFTNHFLKKKILVTALLSGVLIQVNAQQEQVKGATQNDTGQYLSGVSIKAINQTTKDSFTTSSESNGQFNFKGLPLGGPYQFIFSYVGYKTDTLSGYRIQNESPLTISIKLQQLTTAIDEVVIGYGKISRKDVTSSITSIKSEDLNQGVFTNPAQLLQGKVPGLTVSSNNSNPNATPSVTLRGSSTLRSGEAMEPYYVIDGVPGASLSLVAPDDIETIDVLRDASATAIYGSKAANGVIIVTTKRGYGEQTTVNYSGYLAIDKVAKTYPMMNGDQYRGFIDENGFSMEPTDDLGANTNWQDEVLRTGLSHNHNISLIGSSQNTQYSASLNTLDNNGVVTGTDMGRQIGRGFVQTKALNSKLTASFNLNTSITKQNDVLALGDGMSVYDAMYYYLPVSPVKNEDGTWFEKTDRSQYVNPVSLIEENTNFTKTKVIQAHAKLGYKILTDLTYNIDLSIQNRQINNSQYYSSASMAARNQNGRAIRASVEDERKILEMTVAYDKTINNRHKIAGLVGYSWEENNNNDGFQLTTSDFYDDGLSYYNPGMANVVDLLGFGDFYLSTLRMISIYGRLNYAYNGKYLFQATVRRDGSSAFGANNRWATFPSISAAWRISDESFMQGSIFNDLKLRAGYGISGNSLGFDVFTSRQVYGATSSFYTNAFGEQLRTLAALRNANEELRWERTAMINLGLDFAVFNNKISGSLEIYDKNTTDLIYDYPVSTTRYLYGSLTANVGEVNNKGIELSINATPLTNKNLTWSTGVVLSHNKNIVKGISNQAFSVDYVDLSDLGGAGQSSAFQQRLIEGSPVGQFYTWEWAGYNEDGISTFYVHDEQSGKRTGETTITPTFKDRAATGSGQPKFTLGWNNNLTYRQLSLGAMFQGVFGNKIMNATRARHSNIVGNAGQKNILASAVKSENPSDINAHYLSDRYLENGSYLRLANISLSYNLHNISTHFKSMRVYASVNNAFVLSQYKGLDPEVDLGGLTPGIDNRQIYPRTRTYMLGLNFSL